MMVKENKKKDYICPKCNKEHSSSKYGYHGSWGYSCRIYYCSNKCKLSETT